MIIKIMIMIRIMLLEKILKMRMIFHNSLMMKTKSSINWLRKKEESLKRSTNSMKEIFKERKFYKNISEMLISNFSILKV